MQISGGTSNYPQMVFKSMLTRAFLRFLQYLMIFHNLQIKLYIGTKFFLEKPCSICLQQNFVADTGLPENWISGSDRFINKLHGLCLYNTW